MSANSAEALVAKIGSDQSMAEEFAKAASEEEFLKVAAKHGFDVTLADFTAALAASKNAPKGELSDKDLDQVAGGLSIVGVDYAFTAVQTSKR